MSHICTAHREFFSFVYFHKVVSRKDEKAIIIGNIGNNVGGIEEYIVEFTVSASESKSSPTTIGYNTQ